MRAQQKNNRTAHRQKPRPLNSTTRADTFPIPWIGDLLDQLGESVYFSQPSTLPLGIGRSVCTPIHRKDRLCYSTGVALYEFKVMPSGLTNAPAVFQRLMQRVLMGLNPEEGPDFVAVYIDDIVVFSHTLEEHIDHLRLVFERLVEAGLKLKPVKCHFIRREVEYLGHIITPQGLKTNPRLVTAVQDFLVPRNMQEIRRFLGMSSYSSHGLLKWLNHSMHSPGNELNSSGMMIVTLLLNHSSNDSSVLQYLHTPHSPSHSLWKQTLASRALVLYFPKGRKMGSLTQQAVHYLPQSATTASLSWRHLQ